MTDEDWDRDLAVNLNGPFFLCRAALPHLLESGGNIVNVASIAGVEGEVYSAGYCAAKHGLVGLTRALAIEYTKEKLRVNAICPGGMPTPQATEFAAPENADWDLIMRIASPRGFMDPSTSPRRSRSLPVTTPPRSTARCTASTTARARADPAPFAGRTDQMPWFRRRPRKKASPIAPKPSVPMTPADTIRKMSRPDRPPVDVRRTRAAAR